MNKERILIVEDSLSQQILIRDCLQDSYHVTVHSQFETAVDIIKNQNFDLYLLDIQLDQGSGFDLCNLIRENNHSKDSPILFLSAIEEINQRVLGFSLGGDDYIIKPFNPLDLKARVSALLKRTQRKKQNYQIKLGEIEIDLITQTVRTFENGSSINIDLTTIEFKLLRYFAQNYEHVLSREQILNEVWGHSVNVLDRTVDSKISSLRKKLNQYANYINSVHGMGYRFAIPIDKQRKAA